MKRQLTLHEAMVGVLRGDGPLSSYEIAYRINEQGTYRRKDGRPVPPEQISARVNNYPHLFSRDYGVIHLINGKSKVGTPESTIDSSAVANPMFDYASINDVPFRELGPVGHLVTTGLPRHEWLDECGIYVLRLPEGYEVAFLGEEAVRVARNVISPWAIEKLTSKWVAETPFVYIGLAGRKAPRSLRSRLNDLLRHASGRTSDRGPHKGGEIVWQLRNHQNLTVLAFPTDPPPVPRLAESALLDEFRSRFGALPFGNRQA